MNFKELKYPIELNSVADVFKKNNFELYLVGGCIRDNQMGLTPKDWDLTTNANPEKIMGVLRAFPNIQLNSDDSQFGVIHFKLTDEEYEIVTLREDGEYLDNRRPSSVTFGSIEMDSKRRDFTINSMYYDLINNKYIDLNNGLEDLKNNVLRFVGDTRERLLEDTLRAIRAIRFKHRLNFSFPDLFKLGEFRMLDGVAHERIRNELSKMVLTKKTTNQEIINDIISVGMFRTIFGFKTPLDIQVTNTNNLQYLIAEIYSHSDIRGNELRAMMNKLKFTKSDIVITEILLLFMESDNYGVMIKKFISHEALFNDTTDLDAFLKKPLFQAIKNVDRREMGDGHVLMSKGFRKENIGTAINNINNDLVVIELKKLICEHT